jgi:hypothetical protein
VIEHQDRQKLITVTVPVDRPELRQHMLAKAAKELGVKPSEFAESVMSLVSTRVGNIELKISVGGSTHERAIAKIALGFLALHIGDDVFAESYAALRRAVQGQEKRVWVQRPFRALEASVLPPSDGAQHRVIVYTTDEATWSHVEVYGTFGYAVLLSEKPDLRFALPYVWGQNPTTGEAGEGRAALTGLPVPVRELVEPTREDWRPLFRAMWRISREEAIGEIVEREFVIAGYQEGQEVAQTEWDQMWGRIAHQVVALGLPGAPLNLSRPIANVEEFEKIGRALRRRATGRRSTSGDTEP